MASKTSLLGAAGEHYVMCQLLRLGFIPGLPPVGVPTVDIVATDESGERSCAIQVKARRALGRDGGWHMQKKHETATGARLFYCFVDFGKSVADPPPTFVVPSAVVATVISEAHEKWRTTPGKRGQQRKDSDFRRFLPDYSRVLGTKSAYAAGWLEPYRDAWHLLQLGSAVVPLPR